MRHIGGASIVMALLKPIGYILFKTPYEGAQTSLHCALAPKEEIAKYKGLYFSDCKQKQTAVPLDANMASRLNEISAQLVGLKPEEQWWK